MSGAAAYDYIIVGGGSAGCVLANRLSARSANRVLLLEAGRELPADALPADIVDSYPGKAYSNPIYQWPGLRARMRPVPQNAPDAAGIPLGSYVQARVLGGGSTINGQMANRGAPADYAEWEARGAQGWGWQDVLPYFRRIENDLDFDGDLHGKHGGIAVRRIFPQQWNAHAQAAAQAFQQAGYRYLPDQNGIFEDGYFPVAHANAGERRVSAVQGYLGPEIRARANLRIATQATVTALVLEGQHCTGVAARIDGSEQVFTAREVILTAGAVHTPAMLMRAGIGPVGHLREFGISPVQALPGVGQGLMDHPQVALGCFLRPQARMTAVTRRHILVGLRYSSGLAGAPQGDMFMGCLDRTAWHPVGGQMGSLVLWVNKTYSDRGQVRLVSAAPDQMPLVELNLLSDRRDIDRLKDGFRKMAALQASAALSAVSSDPFPASYTERVRQVGVDSRKNLILTSLMARLLDGPAILRRALMRRLIVQGVTLREVLEDDAALEEFVTRSVGTTFHASCTCRMGADDDTMAVTDPAGLVRGIAGLRIADASLFPVVPCANTNFPTFMVAEKIADQVLAGSAGR